MTDVSIPPTKLAKIDRLIRMSTDAVNKLDGMTPARLSEQGWILRDGNWEKKIPVYQFVATEHNDGGVPKVGEVTNDEFLNLCNDLAEANVMSLRELLEVMNNGLYLSANAKGKPKAITSIKAIEMVYFTAAASDPTLYAKLGEAATENRKDEYLKAWFASRGTTK